MLKHERCKSVLAKRNTETLSAMSELNQLDSFVNLIDFEYMRHEVIDILDSNPDISYILNQNDRYHGVSVLDHQTRL